MFLCVVTANRLQQSKGLLWSQSHIGICAKKSVIQWDLCKQVNHVVGFVQRSQSHIGIHVKEKASTRSSPIED